MALLTISITNYCSINIIVINTHIYMHVHIIGMFIMHLGTFTYMIHPWMHAYIHMHTHTHTHTHTHIHTHTRTHTHTHIHYMHTYTYMHCTYMSACTIMYMY